ncbi:HipA domain protein [Thermodesulfatator indicus DSM 15286]|uniref:HipA domain protein n=1 Tax=Thermodesulfatator indicus (strain DSM 15286 / JCM 11887 / CIR29812) TaxID=667014 RepID=F8A7Z2_THEID|nr:HipA domain-containing protein [Thermodesulfatator indicus]AEH43908.1 HipA domain protein [Thermodesulfatator indicus DSM 15286]
MKEEHFNFSLERRLKVWFVDTKGYPHHIGWIDIDREGITFQYETKKFIIDPINLPYTDKPIRTEGLKPPLLIFDDTIPDTWGLKILSDKYDFDFIRNRHLAIGIGDSSRIGALLFSDTEASSPPKPTWVNFRALQKCLEEIPEFDPRRVEEVFNYIGVTGVNIGGAKPKTILVDFHGQPWLVKFPGKTDPAPNTIAQVEVEGLAFARDVGIPVPTFWLVKTKHIYSIAVKRFDITSLKTLYLGRLMLISLSTVMGGLEMFDEGYEVAAQYVKKYSHFPERDVLTFYKQMVLNWFIVNTDDHLKNFAFLWDGETLRLSPAYDLVGNLWGMSEHTMPINDKTNDITPDDLLAAGQKMGFSREVAKGELMLLAERALIYYDRIASFNGTEMLVEKVKERISYFKKV